ncbi:MAG: CRISPR-associated endonuclease Cas3'' [Armatimonadota bacterium]
MAHSENAQGESQSQVEHLQNVADMASGFAGAFGADDEATLAGLLHDIGKYGDKFQRRLEGLEHGLDHWSPGAAVALFEHRMVAAALAVQGHHTGLGAADKDSLIGMQLAKLCEAHPLGLKLSESDAALLNNRFKSDGLAVPAVASPLISGVPESASNMLDVRMLFSALVDADFLDTQRHFKGDIRPKSHLLEPQKAYAVLLDHMDKLRAKSDASGHVNSIRDDLFNACINSAESDIGLWTLSAPTGAGKTLAMLAFALRHAAVNNIRRVVMVVPYLSIIEQTAKIYREILEPVFGENYILEHHSLADNGENDEARLLAENWDAPIIITTSVQMLESLFANRPSACRKLHRLAGSIILFDEVQTLPAPLAVPTLAALSHLSRRCCSSIVFSTATQPAFAHFDAHVREMNGSDAGWMPTEIVPSSLDLFGRARRTQAVWPEPDEALSWQNVADMMARNDQSLCIVNLKRHARELLSELRSRNVAGVYHLSTSMCPAHRKATLDKVRELLDDGKECCLVATQCIEAGVDIDFPVVFRAFADLSSIAQAAGRCNRNGMRDVCDVRVFIPQDEAYPPNGGYEQAADATKQLVNSKRISNSTADINDPALFTEFYRALYSLTKPDDQDKARKLRDAVVRQDFRDVAKLYKLIEQDTVNVLVPYDLKAFESLAEEVRRTGLTANWIRRARPYTVALYRPKNNNLVERLESVHVGRDEIVQDWFIYTYPEDYTDVPFKNSIGVVF